MGAEFEMNQLKRKLRKDTQRALYSNEEFFNKLRDVSEIYSWRFSFSEVTTLGSDRASS